MVVQNPISMDSLREAFSLAEEMLKGDWNRTIAQSIVNDTLRSIQWENSIRVLFASVLSEEFPDCGVQESNRDLDIKITHEGRIVSGIECKGMVSNSHRSDGFKDSLDVWGIKRRKLSLVEADIEGIEDKIKSASPHWEVFVPIVYEIYRKGATDAELYEERKPWTTHQRYKGLRQTLKKDFTQWFEGKYPSEFTLIHAADRIGFVNVGEIWSELCEGKASCTPVSEAYVSFFAFGRYVNK